MAKAKWEYQTQMVGKVSLEKTLSDFLNQAGGDGWELVSSTSILPDLLLIMKRPARPKPKKAKKRQVKSKTLKT